jgi:hypothetical protein
MFILLSTNFLQSIAIDADKLRKWGGIVFFMEVQGKTGMLTVKIICDKCFHWTPYKALGV